MDGISKILGDKTLDKPRNKHIHSEAHYWADVISSAFGERKKFGMYLGVIKRIGVQRARQIFGEIQESNPSNPGKLFVWKSSQRARDSRPEPGSDEQPSTNSKQLT
ncbi:MAG TPA: hypothetical protein DCS29_04255 [Candidatus Magasanikbacteria bacterium]|nr:hypothetical protein [Candidatus Magasanikbacteria bacterium]